MDDISISISVHAAPARAEVVVADALSIHFAGGLYPYIVMYAGSPALATDLAAAINGVLERHRAADTAEAA